MPKAPELPPLPEPGDELNQLVITAFQLSGTSLTAWARAGKVRRQNAQQALKGCWTGPGATKLVNQLLKDSGINDSLHRQLVETVLERQAA